MILMIVCFAVAAGQGVNGQAPYRFSFQGVARDAAGKLVTNANVSVRTKIHKDNPNGTVIFTETQILQTNAGGVFTMIVGGLTGGLDDVNWGSDNCFIQTEIDVNGGANFVDLGTTGLTSVPYALAARKWIDNVPIVQRGNYGNGPTLGTLDGGSQMIWYPRKAAFRVGYGTEGTWGDAAIGLSSFAVGVSSKAMGTVSFAAGQQAAAEADHSIAMGQFSSATGRGAISMGNENVAEGEDSFASGFHTNSKGKASSTFGWYTTAKAFGGIALGTANNPWDNPSPTVPAPTDRIFQIGNGNTADLLNAVTVLRNGNFGIGNNVLTPTYLLDLGARMRIRHNGATAGIHFNNSANNEDGFVGMKTDDEIGFFVNNAWRFWVNSSNAYVNGSLVNTSDRRLKKSITPIGESLDALKNLKGYRYYWKEETQGKELQTGLIAQEVEQYFPELVTTNKDGYKAVNYIGLVPHLIEAVKELDKKTAEINALKQQLASVSEMNKKLNDLEASLTTLLTTQKANPTPTTK